MQVVTSKNDIMENIQSIDKYLADPGYLEFAINLIKKGICFIAVEENNRIKFYPSRYVGYKNNSHNAHIQNEEKDGKETNPAINQILGYKPEVSDELETEYKKYCESLGFTANKSGTWGTPRKYWRF